MATVLGEVDTSVVPGTTHLVDLDGNLNTNHDERLKDIVLVPTPSADPEDPLNWSSQRKSLHMFCIFMYGLPTCLLPMTVDTGLSLADLNAGTGYMFLFFGWGCVIWQPLALKYGKRPVYLFSMVATLAIQMWSPYCKTSGQWFANKILQGFFGSPIESLCEISVADMYFAHERGKYMGLYALCLLGSNILAPIFSGFIYDGMGWRWVLYWPAIGCGFGFLILFFLMEETNFNRHTVGIVEFVASSSNSTKESADQEKMAGIPEPSATAINTHNMYHEKSYWQKLSLLGKPQPNKLSTMIKRPFTFVSLPVIVYCGFSYGCTVMWALLSSATSSLILSSAPYNFKASIVGLFSVASLLGCLTGSLFSGFVGNWLVLKLARQNNGIVETENRLWLFLFAAIAYPFGFILWGVGAAHDIHWFGLAFSSFILSAATAAVITTCVSYCIDTYPDLGGEAMITVIVIRNTMGFAVTYAATPWITKLGVQNTFITAAFISMATSLSFLIMIKWGKQFREMGKNRYWRYVAEAKALSMSH
ncbi:hypothetical protein BP5796_03580 [Coleophoma crateriformis]|uniref:Major facilitator superfamily (MFS) profile domain-containing protein n=1 Tax=Coleophoma crateriformis TaxID=565419 RepID=A0A3D8SNL9_9HELO|nr:hypothetical protein BP5796_03580 [Coleophoma crateriformis]